MGDVIEASLDPMLLDGRIAALRDWVGRARSYGLESPALDLAEAEIEFREGRWRAAETRARRLAERLRPNHPLASRAFYRAGLSAHLNERREAALELHTKAKESARSESDLRQALWGMFVATDELEDIAAARAILLDFEHLPAAGPEDLMRRAQAQLTLATREGHLGDALDSIAWQLLAGTDAEPVVRTAFLHALTTSLSLVARYNDALDAAEAELVEVSASHVHFATPHALAAKGTALLGLRDFSRAERTLDDAWESALEQNDVHAEMNAVAVLARLHLSRGQVGRAIDVTAQEWPRQPSPGMLSDFLSTRALALACGGDAEGAFTLAAEAEGLSRQTEGQVRASFARAVVAMRTGRGDARGAVEAALARATARHNYDVFVSAYRAHPALLDLVVTLRPAAHEALQIVEQWDPALARSLGLARPRPRHTTARLTAREDEILALVAQGLSNREIGRTLWIEETTVKAHLRSILKKLGARSRTEAALMYGS
jgi:DNA-binding NarL/FixJ family response regulator